MSGVDLTRCLTMAAYSGLQALKECVAAQPQWNQMDAIDLARRTNADVASLDFQGALQAASIIERRIDPYNETLEIRDFLGFLIQETSPWWLRVFPRGRDQVLTMLTTDQVQCFRAAGLLDSFPSDDTIAWWDEMNAFVRKQEEMDVMLQAREAEKLSFERECERLKALGIHYEPRWIALEDNTAGYDILSYDVRDERVVNRLVEVKSTVSGVIHVTRNEWNNAASAEPNYVFHVWMFPDRSFLEFQPSCFKGDVPQDRGKGEWRDVQIEIDRPNGNGDLGLL